MKLQRKGTRHSHRGVIGVESAIVMIAFVIVAAALAFVVLNMGFTTSQKAKTSIISSLGEASSSMQVAGKVIGEGDSSTGYLNMTAFPIKVSSGGNDINLEAKTTSVRYVSNSIDYSDIYVGTLTGEFKSLSSATAQAVSDGSSGDETFGQIDNSPTGASPGPTYTRAFIYFTQESTSNDILSQGESAVLAVAYASGDRPQALDKIKVEIITPTGSALTVERQVPTITNTIVDLG
ncbi:archaellin/type IV pilin N-terminal domain-containing protein [Nitrosopumilus adriaticus]|uniref:Flagellin n=1 Tax=Nitrosopumilus adriaticus TaxID=1580092 RepID=A0A0D5C1S6_9ARCH|nr:archaellin/type IV pilin N-terminal domain-containing protein [Nitrosopumilus adriaticus]AJW70508.1 Archaeal flagellin [Nitrosopumilus adriaticus]